MLQWNQIISVLDCLDLSRDRFYFYTLADDLSDQTPHIFEGSN